MKHQSNQSSVEQIVIPDLLAVSIRESPSHIRGGGKRGFVNQPGHPLNDTLVLFPHDGKGMDLFQDYVAFIATTGIIHKVSTSSGKPYLSATPIGKRCFADIKSGRETARGIIRDDIVRHLAAHENAKSANKAFDDVERAGRIPFVMPNHQEYQIGKFNLALQQANHELISRFTESFAHISDPQAPARLIIGGRMTLGGRHDCIMCVANLEVSAAAAAYMTSLGWWVVSAYLSPNGAQWCFVMTSTPQEAWDYDHTPINRAAGHQQPQVKKPVPQRVAPVKQHVPAVAREKPTVVAPSFEALTLPSPPAEIHVDVVIESAAPVMEVSPLAMVMVAPPVVVIDEITDTPEEPISDEEMDQAALYVGQADKEETDLIYAGLHHLIRNNMGNLRVATKATIAELPQVEVTDGNRETVMMTTVPMFLAATPGWTAAVAMELATAGMME